MMYLSSYHPKKDFRVLKESIDTLFESKKTEAEALNILKKNNPSSDENEYLSLIDRFKQIDSSKNQTLLPVIATMYKDEGDLEKVKHTVETINKLLEKNKIRSLYVRDDTYIVDEKPFNNYLRFTEFLHSLERMDKGLKSYKDEMIKVETDEKPIFDNDNITVYDGNEVGKCIKYGAGELTGKSYGFCIGNQTPTANMWQSYRNTQVSTFYYVIDKRRSLDDPLHIVVVDHTKDGFLLTDENNDTGNIKDYGNDAEKYFQYLSKLGVPTDIFKNKPPTPEEIEREKLIGKENDDLDWFKNLDYKHQMNYIHRGHKLSDEQFKFLWGLHERVDGAFALLKAYVDTGLAIPENQFNILVGNE